MDRNDPTNIPRRRVLEVIEDFRKARRRKSRPWKDQQLRESLDIVHDALDEVGAGLGEICGWACGPVECRVRPGLFLEHLEQRIDKTILLGRIDRILRQASYPDALPDGEHLRRLDALDELRFSSPSQARPQARQLLDDVVGALELKRGSAITLCDALVQIGGVECALGNYPEAAACLRRGLTLSRQLALPAREAVVTRLCAFLVANFGEHRAALGLADEACRLSTLVHDLPGIGKSLLIRGIMLRRLDAPEEAIRCYEGALSYLPPEAWQHRCAAWQSLAFVHLGRGELDEAQVAAASAAEEHRTQEGFNWWKLQWLWGEVALQREELEEAEKTFRETRQVFESEGDFLDVALISLRLSKVLLLAGKEAEMREVAAEMVQLLEPLATANRLASQLVGDFVKRALTEAVTLDFLDRAHDEIYKSATA